MKLSIKLLASAGLLALASSSAFAAADEKLRAAAEQAQPAVIESLHDMVLIESGSSDVEGLQKMADYTEARLKALGAKTERRKTTKGAGADMVIGSFEGTGTKKLMLIAHMDTVYEHGILDTHPYKIDGTRIYGPGIADDKGGIAVILHSLKILNDAGWRDYAKLTVSFNPDEEVGSIGSGEIIAELADRHDVVLSFEPTVAPPVAKNESLLLGASGTATGTIDVKGKASHAGAAPQLGRNALIELAHQLSADPGRREIDSGHATELDHREGRHRAQPDPRSRHRRRRHPPHHSRRRAKAAGGARREGEEQTDRGHRSDREGRRGPSAFRG
ncbi:acetylornithine deacetylase/succinyl-diaminopimelate desuccinylase-like protein [Bradyrhizobium elkanii]